MRYAENLDFDRFASDEVTHDASVWASGRTIEEWIVTKFQRRLPIPPMGERCPVSATEERNVDADCWHKREYAQFGVSA